jgi:ABC-type multidrug transport system fused ATPase/permease subunit
MGDYRSNNLPEHLTADERQAVLSTQSWSLAGSVRVPVTLSWENVSYRVKVPTKRCPPWNRKSTQKTILQHISGIVKPGQLLAILGSTGK